MQIRSDGPLVNILEPPRNEYNHKRLKITIIYTRLEVNDYLCMKMQDILDRIIAIEGKLRQTLQSLHNANERNRVLTEENQTLHKERVQLLDKIQDYESRIAKVGKNIGEDSSRDETKVQVKERLQDYISEIDNCIELLKN